MHHYQFWPDMPLMMLVSLHSIRAMYSDSLYSLEDLLPHLTVIPFVTPFSRFLSLLQSMPLSE